MARIFRFPESERIRQRLFEKSTAAAQSPRTEQCFWHKAFSNPLFASVYGAFLIVIVMVWPFLSWLVAIDLVFHLLRAMVLWDTPGVHAGLTCFLHFAVVGGIAAIVLNSALYFKRLDEEGGTR